MGQCIPLTVSPLPNAPLLLRLCLLLTFPLKLGLLLALKSLTTQAKGSQPALLTSDGDVFRLPNVTSAESHSKVPSLESLLELGDSGTTVILSLHVAEPFVSD